LAAIVVSVLGMTALAAPASARALQQSPITSLPAGGMSTMSSDGSTFVEVDNDQRLKRWYRLPSGYFDWTLGHWASWSHARLITSLSADKFIEVTTAGDVIAWEWDGLWYSETNTSAYLPDARLIAGIDENHFVAVTNDGSLTLWLINNVGAFPTTIGNGWQTARLLGGLGTTYECPLCFAFVEVKTNGLLSLWEMRSDFHLYESNIGQGWGTARLLAGLKFTNIVGFNFMEVKTNGLLSEWRFGGLSAPVTETNRGNGWQNARLIG
jgi:hypothetical protein